MEKAKREVCDLENRLEAERATCKREQYKIISAFCAEVEKAKGEVRDLEDRLKAERATCKREAARANVLEREVKSFKNGVSLASAQLIAGTPHFPSLGAATVVIIQQNHCE